MRGFDYNRVGIALACLGVAQVSLEETMAYVEGAQRFRPAAGEFEGVSFAIAEAATHVDACRWLCYRALWLADHGRAHTKESAMTKWWAPRLAVETIHQCLLLHGHYGYTDELPFEQRMRDVIGLEIGDGTAEVMKVIVARELMGRESLPRTDPVPTNAGRARPLSARPAASHRVTGGGACPRAAASSRARPAPRRRRGRIRDPGW